ncbi:MAG: thioredoxin family protein [Candidatus Bipolaricaulota bacterium]|nr:thioredoxin family protein [Candidatus Bipolaricaulota bacterium]
MSGWRDAAAILVLLAIAAAALPAAAQEKILTFAVEPASVEVAAGERATVTVRIENASVREADDIVVTWTGPGGFVLDPAPQETAVLGPFDSTDLAVWILVPEDAPLGSVAGSLEFAYTYCIGDLCFQIFESRDVALLVRARAAVGPTGTTVLPLGQALPSGAVSASSQPAARAWIPYAVAACLTFLVLATAQVMRSSGARWPLYTVLLLAAGAALAYGVVLGQHEQARSIAAVLCTSCVGIEEVTARAPQLSAQEIARIRAISGPVDLLVFRAPWCRSCPFAEALVEQVGALNARVGYRFIDVDREPERARQYGVIQSGRTVVPAIVRLGVDRVLFGVENLESRLVLLLEEGA